MAKTNTALNKDNEGATKSAPPVNKDSTGKFRIIEVNGKDRAFICIDGKADKHGTPKEFDTSKDAVVWINEHTYKGMSVKYEVYDIAKGETIAIFGSTKITSKSGKGSKTVAKTENPKSESKPKTEKKADTKPEPTTEPKAEVIPSENTSVITITSAEIKKHLKALDDAVKSHEKTFFKIGFELYWLYETQGYVEVDGTSYDNIADFAKRRYGISKATTYQYIGIYNKFGAKNGKGECIGIDEKYKDYGSTQLLIMSQMTDEMLLKCTPSQKIHELKAFLKGIPENDDENGDDENSSNGENGDTRKPFNTIKTANTQELYSFTSVEEIEKKQSEIFETIKRTVGQGVNGVNYGISIVMTW